MISIHDELQLSSPKVVAMYEAVNELMEEGRYIYSLKISDITSKAGIGKGTAYEYFATKEELLGKAIFYQLHRGLHHMTEEALKKESFREQIYAVLNDVGENYSGRRLLLKYLCYYLQGMCGNRKCKEGVFVDILKFGRIKETLEHMIRQARKEGMAEGMPDYLAANVLMTQFMGFCIYLMSRDWATDVDMEQMKEFIYHNIVTMFAGYEHL